MVGCGGDCDDDDDDDNGGGDGDDIDDDDDDDDDDFNDDDDNDDDDDDDDDDDEDDDFKDDNDDDDDDCDDDDCDDNDGRCSSISLSTFYVLRGRTLSVAASFHFPVCVHQGCILSGSSTFFPFFALEHPLYCVSPLSRFGDGPFGIRVRRLGLQL